MIKKYVIFKILQKYTEFKSECDDGTYGFNLHNVVYFENIGSFDTELECIEYIKNLEDEYYSYTIKPVYLKYNNYG